MTQKNLLITSFQTPNMYMITPVINVNEELSRGTFSLKQSIVIDLPATIMVGQLVWKGRSRGGDSLIITLAFTTRKAQKNKVCRRFSSMMKRSPEKMKHHRK